MNDTTKIADDIYNAIESTVTKVHIVDGFDMQSARAVVDIAETVLNAIDKVSHDDLKIGTEGYTPLDGAEQRDVATKVIVRLITFDIPWVPNFVEDKVKAYLVNMIIEMAVGFIDKKLGKTWLQ